jgi:hypothetical protein
MRPMIKPDWRFAPEGTVTYLAAGAETICVQSVTSDDGHTSMQ